MSYMLQHSSTNEFFGLMSARSLEVLIRLSMIWRSWIPKSGIGRQSEMKVDHRVLLRKVTVVR
jgi:hypothetical protein